ncbi:MAG: NADH:flavin oxidoreductase [Mesorhizobium sp.]|nr:NADH:flavin oxidoreductase [Mesorhizobium sp.]MCO5160233.1 NADH:flavin oxidoreductase [Mesorhizobium sp.]
MSTSPLFQPFTLGRLLLPNRLVVAPLTRVSATPDGCATDEMVDYYRRYARAGWGLIVSEATYVDDLFSQGYFRQPGIVTDEQVAAWRRVTEAVHSEGGRIVLQLSHAGALGQGNPRNKGTVAPSAIRPAGEIARRYRGMGPYAVPRALDEREIGDVVAAFARAAENAIEAGFDGVEIHGANGYLIHQFLTPDSNRRQDEWGGSLDNRLRFPLAVLRAVRAAVRDDRILGLRLSQSRANDATAVWQDGATEASAIFSAVGHVPRIYLHISSHTGCAPVFDTTLSLAGLARRHSGHPVIANGRLDDKALAQRLLEGNEADLISLGKAAIADPDWPTKVARGEDPAGFHPDMISPVADLTSRAAWSWSQA